MSGAEPLDSGRELLPTDFPDDWFTNLYGPEPCANRSDLDLEDDLRSASTTRSLLAAQTIRDREIWRARLEGARSAWRLARKEVSDVTSLCAEAVRHLAEVVYSPAGLSILGLAKRAAQAVKDLTAQYNGATLDLADLRSVEQGLRSTYRETHEALAAVLPDRLPGIDLPPLAHRVAAMVARSGARIRELGAELAHLRRVVAAQEEALVRRRTHIEESARSRLAEGSALREEIEKLRLKIRELEHSTDSVRRAAAELRAAMPNEQPLAEDLDSAGLAEHLVGLACRTADRLRCYQAEVLGDRSEVRRVLRRIVPDQSHPTPLVELVTEVERRFIAQGARLQAAEVAAEKVRADGLLYLDVVAPNPERRAHWALIRDGEVGHVLLTVRLDRDSTVTEDRTTDDEWRAAVDLLREMVDAANDARRDCAAVPSSITDDPEVKL